MKKILYLVLSAIFLLGCLSGCGSDAARAPENNDSIQIVTTIFPEYDWVMNVLGDNPANAEVIMLLDNGVDLHSYQPTASDILKISTCDLFIYVGGESDGWVDDALEEASDQDRIVLNLMDLLGDSVKAEELVEGMQETEHNHAHEEGEEHDHEEGESEDHDHEEGEEHAEEVEYDEHVWLSLRNASVLTASIADALQAIDPDHAETYADNAAAYTDKLTALDAEYEAAVSDASVATLLFGDRFPFRYLTDDYGLSYYAAFVGCSAETEASFETITFLSQKVDELGLHAVMTIEGNDHRIAETIVQNTQSQDQQILTLDSMQSTTSEDVANGSNYLSIMETNLSVLKDALK